jgi:PKD repeat protein
VAGGVIVYADDPYVTGNEGCDDGNHPNGKPSDGVIQGGLSHEHNESITDPEPDTGWVDLATGRENGDKCRTFSEGPEFGAPLGEVEIEVAGKKETAKYNQEINGHKYWYQQEWSNQGSTCLQRLIFAGARPTAVFTKTASTGNEATLDAAASTAPGGVARYSWQFNDGNEPEETASPTITHLFPSAGQYSVALTVFAKDGTSIGTARNVLVNDVEPVAAFAVATASPTAGSAVSFDASASHDPDGFIVGYAWSFGDGTPAAVGSAPSHVFSAPGTYEVTLIVTDNLGASTSVSRPVIVAPASSGGSSGGGGATTATASAPPTSATPPPALVAATANSGFAPATAAVNAKTGSIALTTSVLDPGKLSFHGTFANGRFGAFTSSACKSSQIKLARRCLPATILYAKGARTVTGASTLTVMLKPTASALKALKRALRRKRAITVTIVLTFQSSRGGAPVTHARSVTVKPRK